jgi:hypothetical protein
MKWKANYISIQNSYRLNALTKSNEEMRFHNKFSTRAIKIVSLLKNILKNMYVWTGIQNERAAATRIYKGLDSSQTNFVLP